uniref:Uncharacterized protein n=1 Tax=Cacopsylla melanoneura TaxID=428564 RepID=A0A8D8X250_9HEMI
MFCNIFLHKKCESNYLCVLDSIVLYLYYKHKFHFLEFMITFILNLYNKKSDRTECRYTEIVSSSVKVIHLLARKTLFICYQNYPHKNDHPLYAKIHFYYKTKELGQ